MTARRTKKAPLRTLADVPTIDEALADPNLLGTAALGDLKAHISLTRGV